MRLLPSLRARPRRLRARIVICAKGAERAHEEYAARGWTWEPSGPVEEGTVVDPLTGRALFIYACRDPHWTTARP